MNPDNGRIYASLDDAKLDGVRHPVELFGREEEIERISKAVKNLRSEEKKKAKRKAAKKARKANRG